MGHFNKSDIRRDSLMLDGPFKYQGYDWWWHSFTGINEKTKEEKPFFIEFFIMNPGLKKDGLKLGQDKRNPKPCYLMVKVGAWGKDKVQLHRFFDLNNVFIHKGSPFEVKADDCYLSETQTKGYVKVTDSASHPEWMCDDGEMSWNLSISKNIAFNVGYGASKPLRDIKAFEMYWHAEGIKTFFEGEIILNGEKYLVKKENSYGYADKNWGRDFTSTWVWLSSNHLYSCKLHKWLDNSAFDIGGGCPKIYFIPLKRKLLGAFYYEGKELEFNFSKFWAGCKTFFDFKEKEDYVAWEVKQSNRHYIMETYIICKKEDMIFVNYESPEGKRKFSKLYNGGNGEGTIKIYKKLPHGESKLIDELRVYNVGCEYGSY